MLVLKKMTTSAGRRLRSKFSLTTMPACPGSSYLVSLFPYKIIHDLGLRLELRRRAIASCTPYTKHGHDGALLLSNVDEEVGRRSMCELTGNTTEYEKLKGFYALPRVFAERVWDSMLEPLVSREEMARRFKVDEVSREAWRSLVEEPLGSAIERYLRDDLVRGLVFTDAKVGVFTHPHDSSLLQNRCFLYHLIGNKTGKWKSAGGRNGRGCVRTGTRCSQSGRRHANECSRPWVERHRQNAHR